MSRKNRKNRNVDFSNLDLNGLNLNGMNLKGSNPGGAPVTIRINHLDIHMDERMYTNNCFQPEKDEELEEPDIWDSEIVPSEEIYKKVATKCGVDLEMVEKVMTAHSEVLIEYFEAAMKKNDGCCGDCEKCSCGNGVDEDEADSQEADSQEAEGKDSEGGTDGENC